jgi:hypothetical protein
MSIFKGESEKMFDALKKNLINIEKIEKPIQIAICERVKTQYLHTLDGLKGKTQHDSQKILINLVYKFDEKTSLMFEKDDWSGTRFFEFVEAQILRSLYICLCGADDVTKLKASNYFLEFSSVKLVEKFMYQDEVNEIHQALKSDLN